MLANFFRDRPNHRPGALTAFRNDACGTAAVDFALVAVPFFSLLFAIFDMGFTFYQMQAVEITTQDIARKVQLGTSQRTGEAFKQQVCAAMAGGLACSRFFVDVRQTTSTDYSEFVDTTGGGYKIKQVPLDGSPSYCPGAPGEYVVIRASYAAPYVSWFWPTQAEVTYRGERVRALTAATVIRIEPSSTTPADVEGCS